MNENKLLFITPTITFANEIFLKILKTLKILIESRTMNKF